MTTKWMGLVLVIGLVIAMGAGRVAAQDTPATTAPPTTAPTAPVTAPTAPVTAPTAPVTAPPDVVELVGGGVVRGTLIENVPGLRASIQLVTGEVRTFSAPEIARVHVGGIAESPAAASTPTTPAPSGAARERPTTRRAVQQFDAERPGDRTEARTSFRPSFDGERHTLRVRTRERGLVLHEVVASTSRLDAFQQLCAAPCTLDLSAGPHTFGISVRDGSVVRASGFLDLTRPTTITLEYENREALRVAGGVMFAVGLVLAGASAIFGLASHEETLRNVGLVVAGVMVPVGMVMLYTQDHRGIHIEPRL